MSLKIEDILLKKAQKNELHNLYLIEPLNTDSDNQCREWTYQLVQSFINHSTNKKNILNHPDVLILKEPAKNYTMDDIDLIFNFTHYQAVEYSRKVLIIENASSLTETHINKLLKTFEEPPIKLSIFLVNCARQHLLGTLYSRSIQLRVPVKLNPSNNSEFLKSLKKVEFNEFCQIISKEQMTIEQLISFLYQEMSQTDLDRSQAQSIQENIFQIEQEALFNNSFNAQLYKVYNCLQVLN